MKISKTNPWWWIPTLYFAEGLPYFIVNNISVIMFNNMGMSKGDMAMYTSLLYLPWVIKPLWSPFVDLIRTKRWWVVTMQVLMSVAFALVAFKDSVIRSVLVVIVNSKLLSENALTVVHGKSLAEKEHVYLP